MKSIDLFAGGGGSSLGYELAGIEQLAAIEFDKYACSTLRHNRPNWNVIEKDITTISNKDIEVMKTYLGELDLVTGSTPCQSFSCAGKELGINDTRGTLFYDYARFLEVLKPKGFIMENVKGLTTKTHKETFELIIKVFNDLGYNVGWILLDAKDYGVAQTRERLFVYGIRKEYKFKELVPEKQPRLVLRDVITNCPNSHKPSYSDSRKQVFDMIPEGGYWKHLPEPYLTEFKKDKPYLSKGGTTGMYRRLSMDDVCLTLTTSPAQNMTQRCHPKETRPLTIEEYARIQSFPDDWKFQGSIAQIYKQIGNAVPVELAKQVGIAFVTILQNLERE